MDGDETRSFRYERGGVVIDADFEVPDDALAEMARLSDAIDALMHRERVRAMGLAPLSCLERGGIWQNGQCWSAPGVLMNTESDVESRYGGPEVSVPGTGYEPRPTVAESFRQRAAEALNNTPDHIATMMMRIEDDLEVNGRKLDIILNTCVSIEESLGHLVAAHNALVSTMHTREERLMTRLSDVERMVTVLIGRADEMLTVGGIGGPVVGDPGDAEAVRGALGIASPVSDGIRWRRSGDDRVHGGGEEERTGSGGRGLDRDRGPHEEVVE